MTYDINHNMIITY